MDKTDAKIDKLDIKLSTRIDNLETKLSTRIDKIDQKFDKVQWLIITTLITVLFKEHITKFIQSLF